MSIDLPEGNPIAARIISRPVGPLQTNFYLVVDTDSGDAFVVDPGDEDELIMDTAREADAHIAAILITHGHQDHIAAAGDLAQATGAPVYGSAETAAVLADPSRHILIPGMEVTRVPDVKELAGGGRLAVGSIDVDAIDTPGHAPGSLTYFAAGGLFCGDLLFQGSIGRTDLPGGSFDTLADSVRRLVEAYPPQTPVFPGHGPVTTLADERAGNPFLRQMGL